MEDFANILQRDYGLKPQGKAAPMTASGSGVAAGNNRGGSSFDKGKSGSDGVGSNYSSQSRAAAHGGEGEEDDLLFRRTNGVSKSVGRTADPALFFGSSPDKVYRGPTKSSFDDMYGERSSGSSSSSSFGDLLGGFNGSASRPRTQTSQGSSNDDLLGGFGPTLPQPAWAMSDGVYSGRSNDPSERRSQSGLTKQLGEDDLLGSFSDSKPGFQAGDFHSSFEDDLLGGTRKSKSDSQAGPSYSSVDGDLLGGFGKSKVQKPSMEAKSSATSPSELEPIYDDFLPGFGVGGLPEATVFTESTVAPNSSSIDGIFSSPADANMFAGIKSTSGFAVPSSEASAFPDSLDPLSTSTGPDTGSSRRKRSLSRVKSDTDGGMYDPFDGYVKPAPVATAKLSEPSSTSNTVPDPGGKISRQGLGNEDGRTVQKSFSSSPFVSDSMDSPVLSPIYSTQLSKGKRAEVYSDDFLSTSGEAVTAFEVKKPSSNVGTYWNSEYQSTAKMENSTGEIWLTIEDVKLVTEPSTSPPPSRAPPQPRTEKEQSPPVTQIKDHQQEKAAQEKVTEEKTKQEAEVRKDIQDRGAKQEEVRDREAERIAERAKKAAERVVAEARERAEKAAVERAMNEARERAEKAAVQRAAAARDQERIKEIEQERERKEKEKEKEKEMERERKEKEKEREKERERDRERDSMRERERATAEHQRKDSAGFRANSEPRQRPSVNPPSSGLFRPSSGNFMNNIPAVPLQRQSAEALKVGDDWTSFFTQPTTSFGELRETEGEPAERRSMRREKHQRIEERAAKALDEKNQRDITLQMEQEERHRSAAILDAEIRRWSMGKEGNLRALLSSLHLMLWPECNWKPVSLADLMTGPSVKKAYQRAILCVHPDKVQQKGATVQQKYIAEKVFDLLKESFAKFNASELY